MRKRTQPLRVYAMTGLVLLAPALPVHATDVVPFVGLRFGGDVGTQPGNGITGPTSVTIDSSVSYGGVIDIPYSQPRSVELYYSHQPTKLSSNSTVGDVTINVLHVGLVDTLPFGRSAAFLAADRHGGCDSPFCQQRQRNPTEYRSRWRLRVDGQRTCRCARRLAGATHLQW
jgi:hypothetical protein